MTNNKDDDMKLFRNSLSNASKTFRRFSASLHTIGVSLHTAGKAIDLFIKSIDTRILSPSFVCGTISKKSLSLYNYNIDDLLNDKKHKNKNLL